MKIREKAIKTIPWLVIIATVFTLIDVINANYEWVGFQKRGSYTNGERMEQVWNERAVCLTELDQLKGKDKELPPMSANNLKAVEEMKKEANE